MTIEINIRHEGGVVKHIRKRDAALDLAHGLKHRVTRLRFGRALLDQAVRHQRVDDTQGVDLTAWPGGGR